MNEVTKIWYVHEGDSPLVATAIHNGHPVRDEVAANLALSESERLREEDPYTGMWTVVADTQIVGLRSRFEVDLNRPREKAVYVRPEDAWGLEVWKQEPSQDLIDDSLAGYDAFYREAHRVFSNLEKRFGRFVVFDLHTYNHRREGPDGPVADPDANPEVNIGTGTMVREKWAPIIDRFIADVRNFDFLGRQLDVRENVKFKGGNFPRWIQENFPESGCAIAVEFKKFFMDEWSGQVSREPLQLIPHVLQSTVPAVLQALERGPKWK